MRKILCVFIVLIVFIGSVHLENAQASSSKTSTLRLANGAVYIGEVKNGQPHGKGTMTYNKDETYQGNWANGKKSGYGKYIYKTYSDNKGDTKELGFYYQEIFETTYQGYWKNDQYHGTGLYTNAHSYKEFDDAGNQSFGGVRYEVRSGDFVDNELTKGYLGLNEDDMGYLVYKDSDVYILMITRGEDLFPNLNAPFEKAFLPYFNDGFDLKYLKNGSDSSKYSIYLSESGMEKGTVIEESLIHGMRVTGGSELLDTKTFTKEYFKNSVPYQSSYINHKEFQKIVLSEGQTYMKLIRPYVKGFTKVHNKLKLLYEQG